LLATRLILVRHGHIAGNTRSEAEGRMNGWTDSPLSPLGWLQANALRERMKRESPTTARYSSPLQRAVITARALSGLPFGPLRLLDELKEIHCGEVDGWTATEARLRYPEVWEANLRQDDDDLCWPGGESYRELRERCLAAVRRISEAHPGERVLVFTHAGVISQLMGVLHGVRPAAWEPFRPGNCSITEIDWTDGAGRLIHFDDRSHLEGLPEAPPPVPDR
jgi:alpha-ribazole phosphatase/probable phosphoglycerate mutase